MTNRTLQDAAHIGSEADLAAHVLDVQGRQLSVKGLLDTGAVVSVISVSTRSDLVPKNIRLTAANQGAIYKTGRTPVISLQLGGRHLWVSFLVVEILDESDQFILARDFVRNLDITIDLNDELIRIKDNKFLTNSERTVCECVVGHISNHSDKTEGKETWLRIASEHKFFRVWRT